MSASVRPIPEGYHSITPQLTRRDAAGAIEFSIKRSLAPEVLVNMPGPNGKVAHAELTIGDSKLMVNDEFPGMAVAPEPSALHSSSLFVYSEDVDALSKRATDAGWRCRHAAGKHVWGDRYGKFTDPSAIGRGHSNARGRRISGRNEEAFRRDEQTDGQSRRSERLTVRLQLDICDAKRVPRSRVSGTGHLLFSCNLTAAYRLVSSLGKVAIASVAWRSSFGNTDPQRYPTRCRENDQWRRAC